MNNRCRVQFNKIPVGTAGIPNKIAVHVFLKCLLQRRNAKATARMRHLSKIRASGCCRIRQGGSERKLSGSAAGHASLQIICQVGEGMAEYLELLENRRMPSRASAAVPG
jgi:hypothetical protein